jgi:hypothetical protein
MKLSVQAMALAAAIVAAAFFAVCWPPGASAARSTRVRPHRGSARLAPA